MLPTRFSQAARTDIMDILSYTERKFGKSARQRYQSLLQTAFRSLSNNPEQAGSVAREELAPGLRSLHLVYCRNSSSAGRVAHPRHMVIYQHTDQVLEIVRILHDAMELQHHLASGAKDPKGNG